MALIDPSGRFAYVANVVSANVSVYTINQTTGALTAGTPVAAGGQAAYVTVDPSGRFAYVANYTGNTVSVYTINQTTGALTAGTPVVSGTGPHGVVVEPTGRFVYVVNYGADNTVSVFTINQATGALTAGTPVATGTTPDVIAVDPSGRFVYVGHWTSNNVSVIPYTINQTTGALTAGTPVAAGAYSQSLAVDPSGKFVYVGHASAGNISAFTIDQITGALTAGPAMVATGDYAVTTTGSIYHLPLGGSIQGTPINVEPALVSTLAGTAGSAGSTDGTGTAARFNYSNGHTTDGTNLYVADTGNHTIRKIVISTREVTTFAGSAGQPGSSDGAGSAARFNNPQDITMDGMNLYVTDYSNHTIRKVVISTGEVTTLVGSAGQAGSVDATGTAARFDFPTGITTDGSKLYVTENGHNSIRQVVLATGVATTLAGNAIISGSVDGMGTAARFNNPQRLTTDGTNLYVADSAVCSEPLRIVESSRSPRSLLSPDMIAFPASCCYTSS